MLCPYCLNEIQQTQGFCSKCGKELEVSVPAHRLMPGTLLCSRYLVGVAKGEGGFGITYVGKDTRLDRLVAIKEYFPAGIVNRNGAASPSITEATRTSEHEAFLKGRERFLNEAKTLARFSGEPGIVHILDFFEENNTAYIVMEYLDGVSLSDFLKQNGTMSADDAVTILMPVMLSLKKIHKQGLIHRDISPSNIMVLKNSVKLIDFGAARHAAGRAGKSISLMLKPGYAPEEQYRSRGEQGPWTDVYALCATLYKCITGVTPEEANDRLHSDELKKPSELGASVDPKFEAALMKGLNIMQQDRYQSVDDLLSDITGYSANGPANTAPAAKSEPVQMDDDEKTVASTGSASAAAADDSVTQYAPRQQEQAQQAYRAPVQPAVQNNYPAPYQPQMPSSSNDVAAQVAKRLRQHKRKKVMLGLLVAAIVIVVALVITLLVLRAKDSEEASSKQASTSQDSGKITKRTVTGNNGYRSFYNEPVTVDSIKEIKDSPDVRSVYISKCEVTQGAIDELAEMGNTIEYLSIEESAGFEDIAPLSKLSKLHSLTLRGCGLKNDHIGKFDMSKLPLLTSIDFSGNPDLSDIDFIKDSANRLYSLKISLTAVKDISLLSDFKRLSTLYAQQCGISDISALKDSRISYLKLSNNEISDISALKGNKSVKQLDIADNKVTDLSALEDSSEITELNVSRNKLSSLSGLEKLIRIKKLECAGNSISSLDGIINCTVLAYVNISSNKISDISVLSKSSGELQAVFMDENNVSDLSPLSSAKKLKCISFNKNKVSDISKLSECTKLIALSGDENSISTLDGITNMTDLKCISFAHNSISDMSPIERLSSKMSGKLYVLDLSSNKIQKLALASGKTYENVLVYNDPLTTLDNVKQIKGLTIAVSYFEGIKLSELKEGYLKLTIVDCPLDKQMAIEKEVGRYFVTFATADEKEKDTKEKKETVFKQINV